jgi:lactate dehydrogenase-like 2-hydroxyacid dehydrogenase
VGAGSIGSTLKRYLSVFDVEITNYSRSGNNGSKKMEDFDIEIPLYIISFFGAST